MKKKILILGSSGMLGHVVYNYFKNKKEYEILDISRSIKMSDSSTLLDITNKEEIETFIFNRRPDLVINCIGVLIKGSNNNSSNAIYINSYFPHFLSSILHKIGSKLIHISTDCVFSGKSGFYSEESMKDAQDIYGLSKSLGEVNNEIDLTIRTSIVGPELKKKGEGLFDWFMKQNGQINGYTNAFWGGVTTIELAKIIEAVINQNINGLINVTNGEKISKFEMLNLFKSIFKRTEVSILPFKGKEVDKSLKSLRKDFVYDYPEYELMFQEMYYYMKKNSKLYENLYTFL